MMTTSARLATLVATVLVGLSAGFFYTHEASVTLALAEVDDEVYVETFQAINETIRNPAFALAFFGSVPALLVTLALSWREASTRVRFAMVAALVLYIAGIVVTATGNVPLNEDLADVTGLTPERASAARAAFEADWNRLNLIRSIGFVAAFLALVSVPHVDAITGREPDGGRSMGQNR